MHSCQFLYMYSHPAPLGQGALPRSFVARDLTFSCMYKLKSDISQDFSSFHPWHVSVTLAICKVILLICG